MNHLAVDRAQVWLNSVGQMLREKNEAYGDSLSTPIRVFSRASVTDGIRVRIDDKLSRIARGTAGEKEDVLKDLVGYIAYLATSE